MSSLPARWGWGGAASASDSLPRGCRVLLPEPSLLLTCWHEFPGTNPKFSPALPFLGANRQRPLCIVRREHVLLGAGGGLADRASGLRGPLTVPASLKKRRTQGNGLASGALTPLGLALPTRAWSRQRKWPEKGRGGQRPPCLTRAVGGGEGPGPRSSSAGLGQPETFGSKVGVSVPRRGDPEPRSQGEQGRVVGAWEVGQSLPTFPSGAVGAGVPGPGRPPHQILLCSQHRLLGKPACRPAGRPRSPVPPAPRCRRSSSRGPPCTTAARARPHLRLRRPPPR